MPLTVEQLNDAAAEEAGLPGPGSTLKLVVCLDELFFGDVLNPV
jgi:hypothetical protein